MAITIKAGYFIIDLLMPLVVGYFSHSQGRLNDTTINKMITVNILCLYPVLSIISFWGTQLNTELMWLPLLGVVMSIIPGVIAFGRAKVKYQSGLDQGSYILSAILSNTVTLGGLSVYILYGEAGFAYVQLIALFSSIVLFLVCFPLAQYYYQSGREGGIRLSVWDMLVNRNQLPVLGIFLGAILNFSGVQRPPLASALFDPLVHIAAWTALIPVGYSTDFSEMKKYWKSTLDLTGIKFIATPLLTYVLARMVISDPLVLNTVLVTACAPAAINAVVAVKIHDLNIHIATTAFALTTAVYLFVVYPLLFAYLSFAL